MAFKILSKGKKSSTTTGKKGGKKSKGKSKGGEYHPGGFKVTDADRWEVRKGGKPQKGWAVDHTTAANGTERTTITTPAGTTITVSELGKQWGTLGGETVALVELLGGWGIPGRTGSLRQMVTTGRLHSEGKPRAASTGIKPPAELGKKDRVAIKALIG